jgi:hypothetical protein
LSHQRRQKQFPQQIPQSQHIPQSHQTRHSVVGRRVKHLERGRAAPLGTYAIHDHHRKARVSIDGALPIAKPACRFRSPRHGALRAPPISPDTNHAIGCAGNRSTRCRSGVWKIAGRIGPCRSLAIGLVRAGHAPLKLTLWRTANYRASGDQVSRVAALALKRGKSVDFTGYWQRHIAD